MNPEVRILTMGTEFAHQHDENNKYVTSITEGWPTGAAIPPGTGLVLPTWILTHGAPQIEGCLGPVVMTSPNCTITAALGGSARPPRKDSSHYVTGVQRQFLRLFCLMVLEGERVGIVIGRIWVVEMYGSWAFDRKDLFDEGMERAVSQANTLGLDVENLSKYARRRVCRLEGTFEGWPFNDMLAS